MVDVDSAMRASAYGGKRRKKSDEDKQKEKDGRVIEPFDPAETAKKETAEAYSMWIVIIFGLSVCLFTRYVFMPGISEPTRALWLLPMLLIITIPSMHKVLIPREYYDLFTTGNWFRAGFLYFFTFIALSFVISNPPMGDIAAPTLSGGLDIETNEAVVDARWSGGTYYIETNQDVIDVVLGMGVRDSVDAETAVMSASIWYRGEIIANLSHGEVGELDEAQQRFDEVDGNWTRGNSKGLLTKGELGPKVASRSADIGLAWEINDMQLGDYEVRISLSEEGDPWDNTWEATYTINVVRVA